MLKFVGLLLMLPLGAAVLNQWKTGQRDRLTLRDELIAFLGFLEKRVRGELMPLTDAINEYKGSERLKKLIASISKSSLDRAECLISVQDVEILTEILCDSSDIGYSRQAEKIANAQKRLLNLQKAERERVEKEEKAYPVIAIAIAAGLFILVA